MEWNNTNISIFAGIFLFAGIIAWLILPSLFATDQVIFLTTENGGIPTSCAPANGLVLAQNLTDLCDVTIIDPITSQIIQFNGSQWVNVNTTSIGGTLANLNDVGIVNPLMNQILTYNTTTGNWENNNDYKVITVSVTGSVNYDNNVILCDTNSGDVTITLPSVTSANIGKIMQIKNMGSGSCILDGNGGDTIDDSLTYPIEILYDSLVIIATDTGTWDVYANYMGHVDQSCLNALHGFGLCIDNVIHLKNLLPSTGISMSANGTNIIITNTSPESTSCSDTGTGNGLCNGGNVNIKSLIAGTGIGIADTTDDYTFSSSCANTGTGEAVCESANNINSLIGGTDISITDTTGDLTIASVDLIKLCEANASGGETSLQCSLSTTPQAFYIQSYFESSSTDTWQLRFNADGGNNYAQRSSTNGGADATTTSVSSIASVGTASNQGYHYFFSCDNPASGKEKHCYGFRITSATGAGNADSRVEFASKWANTASNISTIDLVRSAGTGTMNAGGYIIVFGVY